MVFRDYSEAFKIPLPAFPRTEVSLDRLIAAFEKLRELDIAGYGASQGKGLASGERPSPPNGEAKHVLGFCWRHGRARPGELGQSFAPLYLRA